MSWGCHARSSGPQTARHLAKATCQKKKKSSPYNWKGGVSFKSKKSNKIIFLKHGVFKLKTKNFHHSDFSRVDEFSIG
jgi:hypothetical protein